MVDRPGLQMLRDFEARLLFRLIGRRTLEPLDATSGTSRLLVA